MTNTGDALVRAKRDSTAVMVYYMGSGNFDQYLPCADTSVRNRYFKC